MENPYQIGLDGKIKTKDLDYNFFEISKVNKCCNWELNPSKSYGYIENDTLVSVMGSYGCIIDWNNGLPECMPTGIYNLSFEV
ncbi:MAG: hypothetical protein V8R81_03180 [Clostridia bacterium]